MRNTIRMIGVLTIVGFISGVTLVLMYEYANPIIQDNLKKEIRQAIFKIFPKAKDYRERVVEDETVFEVRDKGRNLLGYAFLVKGNGYQGTIKIIAGIEPDLKTLLGIEILESQETPGLGQEITQDKFKVQFKGLNTLPEIIYVKNKPPEGPNEIRAITGATISSSAVVSMLNKKIKEVRDAMRRLR